MMGCKRFGVGPASRLLSGFFSGLMILWLISGCSAPAKPDEELRKEIQGLKQEVKALQEKVGQLEASLQAARQEFLKQAVAPPPVAPVIQPPPAAPPAPEPLTVGQLLAGKDQYVGRRVTVKGAAGPVMVHHKSLFLKGPEGMVEVRFGKLPDEKLVQQLTSIPLEKPVTVTGIVNLPPKTGGAALVIDAEAIDF